jgi:hypothetical protein
MNTPVKRIENKVQGVLNALTKLNNTLDVNSAALTDDDKAKIEKTIKGATLHTIYLMENPEGEFRL